MSKPPFQFRELRGAEIAARIEALGHLRIAVFREYPYLYDGDLEYERRYLADYAGCPRALVVLLELEGRAVGATTCLPLAEADPAFRAPFEAAGRDPAEVLYLGESLVLPPHRGGGAGAEFFARREAHGRALGAPIREAAFCAVDRPPDHPARPRDYRSPESLWRRHGYRPQPELRCQIAWREIGEIDETPKSLTFWTKPLS